MTREDANQAELLRRHGIAQLGEGPLHIGDLRLRRSELAFVPDHDLPFRVGPRGERDVVMSHGIVGLVGSRGRVIRGLDAAVAGRVPKNEKAGRSGHRRHAPAGREVTNRVQLSCSRNRDGTGRRTGGSGDDGVRSHSCHIHYRSRHNRRNHCRNR